MKEEGATPRGPEGSNRSQVEPPPWSVVQEELTTHSHHDITKNLHDQELLMVVVRNKNSINRRINTIVKDDIFLVYRN
jgi:hypothetical protein